MFNSIQQFEDSGITKIEKIVESFMKDPKDMAAFVYGIRDVVISLGLNIIQETLEDCNQMLCESGKRRQNWEIVKTDSKKLITSLGEISFQKTLFKNKNTGERCYLLGRIMGIESHERMTEDAEVQLLKEAVQTSYQKAGEEISLTEQVSRQAVKNKVHSLEFPKEEKTVEKKVVDYLYIDADEDHVPLQFREKKGDLTIGENHWKNNCVLAKLVYVYEGVEPEGPKSKRNKLIHPYYFSGVYDGADNRKLWEEVSEYLESHYDLEKVKRIYLNADGGSWIRGGKEQIAGCVSVLDEFHLMKYILKLTGHMEDRAEDARREIYEAILHGHKEKFEETVKRIDESAKTENAHKRIAESEAYILSNWTAARMRLRKQEGVEGCSAEGHVSHILSARMSSRPMGWSRKGVDRMAHLRAYYWNGGDMLELVRKQKRKLPKAAGSEEELVSCEDILKWERKHQKKMGKYVEGIRHDIVSIQGKKYAWFKGHIWGL